MSEAMRVRRRKIPSVKELRSVGITRSFRRDKAEERKRRKNGVRGEGGAGAVIKFRYHKSRPRTVPAGKQLGRHSKKLAKAIRARWRDGMFLE